MKSLGVPHHSPYLTKNYKKKHERHPAKLFNILAVLIYIDFDVTLFVCLFLNLKMYATKTKCPRFQII